MTAVGLARPREQGQAMARTVRAWGGTVSCVHGGGAGKCANDGKTVPPQMLLLVC